MAKGHIKFVLAALVASVFAFGAAILSSNVVYAEDRPAIFLQVSPAKIQLGELEPGETKTGTFKVQNVGTEGFDYRVYVTPYQVNNDQYEPNYSTENSYTQIKDWITLSTSEGHLDSDTDIEITYTIKVPEDAPGGGQYASIMAETGSGNDENATVKTISRVGVIVYSHVNGETNSCGKIVEQNIKTFLITPPITATSIVENCGNVDLDATYYMQVFPLFSDEEIYTNEEQADIRTTLPETRRFNQLSWESSPWIGIYKVRQTVKYGDDTQSLEKLVVICPIWVIVLVIIFIGVLIFVIVSNHKGSKKSKSSD